MGAGPARNERSAAEPLADQLQGRQRWAWFFSGIWLLYLTGTLSDALANSHVALRILGAITLAAFGALYVWSFLAIRRRRRAGEVLQPRTQAALLGGALALIVVEAAVAGESALVMGTFLAVMALFTLRIRPALAAVAGIVVLSAGLPYVVPDWEPDGGQIALGTATAALAVFGILQLVHRNVQLDEARRELADLAVVQERGRFARDLHDLLGHSLTVVTVKAELAGRLVRSDPDRAEREIADVERLARDTLADVRSAVAGYRDTSLGSELVSARLALDAAGIEADLPNAIDDVPGDRRELFGWAVREGVTNVVRHSGARHCRISVTSQAAEIVDDGRGPAADAAAPGPGVTAPGAGLDGLRERAAAVGASVIAGRARDGGFRLRVGW